MSREPEKHRSARRSVYIRRPFDWQEDAPLVTPLEDTIIYELHVRGFTCHPSSLTAHPGTFAGLIEKIPYLQALGVTAVELLPIHEFDENDCPFVNPVTGETLRNFWGYNSIAFGAPKAAYASTGTEHGQVVEFREMVRAFHAAGIEVYPRRRLQPHRRGRRPRPHLLLPRPRQPALLHARPRRPLPELLRLRQHGQLQPSRRPQPAAHCLRFWVADMHVDGFRFDLASVLGRDHHGNVLVEPPVVEMIAEDALLQRHQADRRAVGRGAACTRSAHFPFGRRWSEWNGRYRDDVRRFWRGEPGMAGRWRRGCAAAPTSTNVRPRPAAFDQLHHLPRRLHALGPGLATTTSTTRPTARTTATAATPTAAGTAASRGRPTTRPSSACAGGRRATCWRR